MTLRSRRGARLAYLLSCSALAVGALAAGTPGVASAATAPTWRLAPAIAPPPPAGAQADPYPVPLGLVSDISFWSPNRGLLMTQGTGVVPAGLYAYDGATWHQLSSVCGGTADTNAEGDGRAEIAWAGPDEFWTISDQRPGQILPGDPRNLFLHNISICHFKDGVVVGSYAKPVGAADAYQEMTGAACRTANDCWFGGIAGSTSGQPATGAFHLHWDGSQLTEIDDATSQHPVSDMAAIGDQIFESNRANAGATVPPEDPANPTLVSAIGAPGAAPQFSSALPSRSLTPSYGVTRQGVPGDLTGEQRPSLGSDWHVGEDPSNAAVWLVAGPSPFFTNPRPGFSLPQPIALRYQAGTWTQLMPNRGTLVTGEWPAAVAPESGAASAWISLDTQIPDGNAHLAHVSATGQVSETMVGVLQGLGDHGEAGPIACPATNDCWMATDQGWLFHYTDGTRLARDTDPSFAGVISYRPPDAGVPFAPPDAAPADDSLANQAPAPPVPPVAIVPPEQLPPPKKAKKKPALVGHVARPQVLDKGRALRIAFTLSAKARVQFTGVRRGKVVARTKRAVLTKGRRHLDMRVSVKRWPTRIELHASPAPKPKPKPAKKRK